MVMNTSNAKFGWILTLAGILLLIVIGRLDLLVVLIPTAAVLAFGVLWFGHKHHGVTHGLK